MNELKGQLEKATEIECVAMILSEDSGEVLIDYQMANYQMANQLNAMHTFNIMQLLDFFKNDEKRYRIPVGGGEKSSSHALYDRFNFLWRLFATALGFSLFGSGGLLLCLTIFPLIVLFTKDKQQRINQVRFVIRHTFRLYLSVLKFLGILNIEVQGLESLQQMRGHLVICNHPSLLDVVIIMSRLKNIQCLVNRKLWTNPFVGLIVRSAGYIRNDIDPEIFLQKCKEMLARGENVLIFPEGTRSVPNLPMKMCRGFANLALCAEADIQALTLTCTPVWLTKGSKWYEIPSRPASFVLQAGPQFSYKNYCHDPLVPYERGCLCATFNIIMMGI